MPHISKHTLHPKVLKLIFAELSTLIGNSNNRSAPELLHELLTVTEQTMLAKRLAAVVMLSQKKGVYVIATRLNLSTSTVRLIALAHENGEYEHITLALHQNKKDSRQFWELIELISRGGMPSMGKDRWKSLDKVLGKT